jgi:WD40 repeat protein/serine/threonine protein kinase
MAVASPAELLAFLQEHGFLTPAQARALGRDTQVADGPALVRVLVERNWLTPYQSDKLLEGRGEDLLLGDYHLLELLGEGGMGQVFKARHAGSVHFVALKTIPRDRVSDPVARARFDREVRAVAELLHPNIVTAFEAHQAGPTHFLVMEYVDGIDLARLVQQSGPLSIPSACEYIRQAAAGLQHAHEKGLVHRDIKPGNLMVARPDPDGPLVVKILDFGLARFESESAHPVRLTQLGTVVGTVDYIAPEQARNARTADIRADIYSLGCSLFYLLTAEPPFAGEDAVQKISARALGGPPSVRERRPEVSPTLERVLMKMMARGPAERYQTPGEVATALTPHTEKTETQEVQRSALVVNDVPATSVARPPSRIFKPLPAKTSPPEQRRRTAGRTRAKRGAALLASGAAGCLMLGLLAGFGGAVFWAIRKGEDENARQSRPAPPTTPVTQPGPPPPAAPPETPKPNLDEIRLAGHRWTDTRMAFAPDGIHVVTAGPDGVLRLWDLRTSKEVRRFEGHVGSVTGLAVGPSLRHVLSGGGDRSLRLWDAATGAEILQFPGLNNAVEAVTVSSNGRQALSRDSGPVVRLWDLGTGQEVRQFNHRSGLAGCVAFSPDGKYVLTGSGVGPGPYTIFLWDAQTGAEVRRFTGHTLFVRSLAFSADGRRLLSGSSDRTVRLWEVSTGKELRRLEDPDGNLQSVALAPGGRAALSTDGKAVRLWDVETGVELPLPDEVRPRQVLGLAFAPDGRHALAGCADGSIWRWPVPTLPPVLDRPPDAPPAQTPLAPGEVRRFIAGQRGCMSAAATPDGQLLLGCGGEDELWVWRVSDGKRVYSGHDILHPWCMAVSPDGRYAAIGTSDGPVVLWDVKNRVKWKSLPGHRPNRPGSVVMAVAFSPDGKRLLSVGLDNCTRHWDVETGREVRVDRDKVSHAGTVAFSPDGRHYVTNKGVFSTATNMQVAHFNRPLDCVAVAPDNRRVVTGGDNTVRVWDLHTGKELLVLGKHQAKVEHDIVDSVAVSPNGRWVLSGGRDGVARLWELDSGREVGHFDGHAGHIRAGGFLNNSPLAFTANPDYSGKQGGVHLWRLPEQPGAGANP